MKKILFSSLLLVLVLNLASAQFGRDRTGYEGDYFSLEGALELFEASQTIRDFERKLNTQDRWVNNLDLDLDGQTDYIRVEHRRQRDYHAIILQAIVGPYDVQDVAVIEIEQTGRQEAVLQIIGDEDMYGQEVFVEPVMGYANSRRGYNTNYGEFVNVFYWPVVQFILGPRYTNVYVSPYRWQYYPVWWNTWRPVTWNVFRPRIVVYHTRFRIVSRHRLINVRRFYRPYRAYCYDVVVRSNRNRVRYGRQPIYRPRQNNRNRFNNSRGDFRGRGRDRAGVADVRTNPSRNQTPSLRRDDRRNDNPRLRPQSRNVEGSTRANPRLSQDRRSPSRTNERAITRNPSQREYNKQRSPNRNVQGRSPAKPSYSRERQPASRSAPRPSVERNTNRSDRSRVGSQSRNFENRRPSTRQVSPPQKSRSRISPNSSDRQRTVRKSTPSSRPSVSRERTTRAKTSPSKSPSRVRQSAPSRSSSRSSSSRSSGPSRKRNQ